MAIFSLHHSVIGKATQARPNTAAAHIRYITRDGACRLILARRLPERPGQAGSWFKQQEAADRKNARVCDKLMLAIPRELDIQQREILISEFGETVSQGRAPWFAAIHDKGKDARNPHCHLVIRDRDFETGKRVLNTSERGSTERIRALWEDACNQALARARSPERVSRLSNRDRGIERKPGIHIGPKARELDRRGRVPRSRAINARNAPTARSRWRVIDYPTIDRGRTRARYWDDRARDSASREADYWEAIDADREARRKEEMEFEAWRERRRRARERDRGRER